jgi:hypothetical protein
MDAPIVRRVCRPKWYLSFELACLILMAAFMTGVFVGHEIAELEKWLCCR